MIQNQPFLPVDASEPAFESLEMCVDEVARYDELFADKQPVGIADRLDESIVQNQIRAPFDDDDNDSACIDNDYVGAWLGLHRGTNSTVPIFGAAPNELPNRAI
jgi:hypothetical protein